MEQRRLCHDSSEYQYGDQRRADQHKRIGEKRAQDIIDYRTKTVILNRWMIWKKFPG
jgi:hypothetical protein